MNVVLRPTSYVQSVEVWAEARPAERTPASVNATRTTPWRDFDWNDCGCFMLMLPWKTVD
jgi:hypothetical protein